VQISIRAVLIAHTRGAGKIIIEKTAFIGPHAVVACSAGRTLRIGEGAVIGPGCVITRSIPPHAYVSLPAPRPQAFAKIPITTAKTMEEFIAGLSPWR
jgi:serine acetyltransferase